jgi:hypothetical protein
MFNRSIAVIVAVGFIAAALVAQSHRPTVTSSTSTGFPRFQIINNPNVRADTFLLDTETGKIWKPVQFTVSRTYG